MAEKTVREEMAGMLGSLLDDGRLNVTTHEGIRRALDRHRAEPEEPCHCKANECGPECPCYIAGTEAQREPAGRGTA